MRKVCSLQHIKAGLNHGKEEDYVACDEKGEGGNRLIVWEMLV